MVTMLLLMTTMTRNVKLCTIAGAEIETSKLLRECGSVTRHQRHD